METHFMAHVVDLAVTRASVVKKLIAKVHKVFDRIRNMRYDLERRMHARKRHAVDAVCFQHCIIDIGGCRRRHYDVGHNLLG